MPNLSGGQEFSFPTLFDFYRKVFLKGLLFVNKQGDEWGILLSEVSQGVVGIARAFLGSGARSVLAALWAIEDLATKQFTRRFYEHLVRGESASESLHQTMKWMRGNGFSEVRRLGAFRADWR